MAVALLAFGLLAVPLAAAQPKHLQRIGVLGPGSAAASGAVMEAFRAGLRVLTVVALTPDAGAEQAGKVPRIGVLHPGACEGNGNYEAFRRGLRELGYLEGQTVVLECRAAESRSDRLPALARELVQLNVAILVTDGTAATRAVLSATRTIPVVMGTVGDPVASGFAATLARPGGNATGLTS